MLRVLIVDDEAPARKRLRRLLEPMIQNERVEIIGEAGDGAEAVEKTTSHPVDLLLLDIRMPEMTGFDVVARLPTDDRPEVVFTTAYDHYALRAFEANAVDYLLKPITQDRLEESISRVEDMRETPTGPSTGDERLDKLLDWFDTQMAPSSGSLPSEGTSTSEDSYARQITVSYRDRIRVIPTEQIASIEISEGITRLFVEEESEGSGLRQYVTDYTLDTLESNLDPQRFMRVHRSAIVQLPAIQEMIPWHSGRYKLILSHGHEVVASRDRSKLLRERLSL